MPTTLQVQWASTVNVDVTHFPATDDRPEFWVTDFSVHGKESVQLRVFSQEPLAIHFPHAYSERTGTKVSYTLDKLSPSS